MNRPRLSSTGLAPTREVPARDEHGQARQVWIAGERPLTIYLDRREIVTLMTLGTHPELLVLGYLLNQRLVDGVDAIAAVQVDWSVASAAVTTRTGDVDLSGRLAHRIVTTGCGQGTMFGSIEESLVPIATRVEGFGQRALYGLLETLAAANEVYRRAGAVHGCALCRIAPDGSAAIEIFVEDVGRHNAADAIAGHMRLEGLDGAQRVFYTTGRLTSEMVIKVAQIGVGVLVSRSGITEMGLELAQRLGVTLIARAKGRHFLLFHDAGGFAFDA